MPAALCDLVVAKGIVRVIPASASQLDGTVRAIRACISKMHSLGIDQWDEEYPDRETVSTAIDNQTLHLIEQAGSVVVGAGLDTEQPPEYRLCAWHCGSPALVVHHLFVHPDHWRNGYASHFMNFVEKHAKSSGLASVRLDAYAGNPAALSLYQARGYSEVGEVTFPRRLLKFKCFEKPVE
ncbi:MAG: GNAT family N-acetyltransferase [Haliea sp.]|uniref:GNAT family N-acetyltransferase n=1 Tax=Haliea sp. TaxID=1932666 RepID=UPI0032EFE3E8